MTILTTNDLVTILSKCTSRDSGIILASGMPEQDGYEFRAIGIGEESVSGYGVTPQAAIDDLFNTFLQEGLLLRDDFIFPPKRVSIYRVGQYASDYTTPLLRQFVSTKYLRIPKPDGEQGIPAIGGILPEFAISYQGSRSSAARVLDTLKVTLGLAS